MKKLFCISLLTFTFVLVAMAQPKTDAAKPAKMGGSYEFNVGVDFPLWDFKDLNKMGYAFNYAWSDQRFGKRMSQPSSLVGFTFNFGIVHYTGADDHRNGGHLVSLTNIYTY